MLFFMSCNSVFLWNSPLNSAKHVHRISVCMHWCCLVMPATAEFSLKLLPPSSNGSWLLQMRRLTPQRFCCPFALRRPMHYSIFNGWYVNVDIILSIVFIYYSSAIIFVFMFSYITVVLLYLCPSFHILQQCFYLCPRFCFLQLLSA